MIELSHLQISNVLKWLDYDAEEYLEPYRISMISNIYRITW